MTATGSGAATLEMALSELVKKHCDARNDWYAWRNSIFSDCRPGSWSTAPAISISKPQS